VPVAGPDGRIGGVVSVAIGPEADDRAVSAMIRAAHWG
jgi:hypothetical protein